MSSSSLRCLAGNKINGICETDRQGRRWTLLQLDSSMAAGYFTWKWSITAGRGWGGGGHVHL